MTDARARLGGWRGKKINRARIKGPPVEPSRNRQGDVIHENGSFEPSSLDDSTPRLRQAMSDICDDLRLRPMWSYLI